MADDSLNTFITAIKDGKPSKQTLVNEPLRWWRERGELLYPTLASMAYDLFSIPAMSAECERAFSLTKKLITDERYNLKPDIIEADQCIKSWCKHGIVNGQAASLLCVTESYLESLFYQSQNADPGPDPHRLPWAL
jgi:hypothetical protein